MCDRIIGFTFYEQCKHRLYHGDTKVSVLIRSTGGSSVSLSPLAPTLQRIDADTVAHERLIVETRLAKSAIDIKHLVRIRVPRDAASAVTTGRSQSDAWRMLCVHNPGYTQP